MQSKIHFNSSWQSPSKVHGYIFKYWVIFRLYAIWLALGNFSLAQLMKIHFGDENVAHTRPKVIANAFCQLNRRCI